MVEVSLIVLGDHRADDLEAGLQRVKDVCAGHLEVLCADLENGPSHNSTDCSAVKPAAGVVRCASGFVALGKAMLSASGKVIVVAGPGANFDQIAVMIRLCKEGWPAVFANRFHNIGSFNSCKLHIAANLTLAGVLGLVSGVDIGDVDPPAVVLDRDVLEKIVVSQICARRDIAIRLAAAGVEVLQVAAATPVSAGRMTVSRFFATLAAIVKSAACVLGGRSMLRNTVLRSLPLILVIMLFLITDGPSLSVGTMMSEGDGFLEVSLLHFAPEMQEPLREDGSYASISSALSWFRQHHIDSYACGEKLMGLPASDDASGGDAFALKIVDSILAEYVCMRATTDGYPWLHRSDASPYLLTTTDRAVPVGYRQVAGWGKVVIAARSGLSVLEGP